MIRTARSRRSPFRETAVLRVRDDLARGRLGAADLSARRLARYFKQTTSIFYHHFGSFERFLYRVSTAGAVLLADELADAARARRPLLAIAERYLEFALTRPALFDLIFAHPFPWDDLRAAGLIAPPESMRAWEIVVDVFRRLGSAAPVADARLFHAALHGVARLTLDRRMNIGALTKTDLAVARQTLRRLAHALAPAAARPRSARAR